MSFLDPQIRLQSRNEGKLKSYTSCSDVRAWSHDGGVRDHYLRQWIRCDMAPCFIPTDVLISLLSDTMNPDKKAVMPRCHKYCKSKEILESICVSSHAMRMCLRNDKELDSYFVEEELETSHWPCSRCLEALKTVKLFWKIIVDKIFHTSIPKNEHYDATQSCESDSLKNVARDWQKDIIKQASFVNRITKSSSGGQLLVRRSGTKFNQSQRSLQATPSLVRGSNCRVCKRVRSDGSLSLHEVREPKQPACNTTPKGDMFYPKPHKGQFKCIPVRERCKCIGCNTCNMYDNELKLCKTVLKNVQNKCNEQQCLIEKFQKEIKVYKKELQYVNKKSEWLPKFPEIVTEGNIPKPYETIHEEDVSSTKTADSEMLITMKNFKDNDFKHVSLLQVLHKTNALRPDIAETKGPCIESQEPINVLSKVRTTLGAIVRREMSILQEKKCKKCGRVSDVEASLLRFKCSETDPTLP